MSGTSAHDDGFREIHLSGKQLVFLFMAATVVLVVTFLTGVLVGRGVRAERSEAAQVDTLTESPDAPERSASATPVNAAEDPRTAPPPPQAEDDADGKAAKAVESEEPPMAVNRNPTPAPAPEKPAAPAEPAAKPAPARPEARPEPAKAEAPKADPKAPAATGAPGNGYAVQVAAVNARGDADAIVKRLSGKGYAAYVETPKGSASVFRVRVGTFKTRREAQTVADKLKKEEKFKPWVTR